jgi:hypothetical protein
VQFKPAQLALLPTEARSMLPPPDIQNPDAYQVVGGGQPPLRPAAAEAQGLTDEQWQGYLRQLKEQQEAPCT